MKGQKTILSPDQVRTLTEWITLKILVGENDRPETSTTIRAERDAFKVDRTIPPKLRIWIGFMPDRSPWPGGLHYQAVQIRKVGDEKARPNLYCMTIAIGQLIVFAINASISRVDLHDMWRDKIRGMELLYPRYSRYPRAQPWPLPWGLSGTFIKSMTTHFTEFANELIRQADGFLLTDQNPNEEEFPG
jgi:hypothetical protein